MSQQFGKRRRAHRALSGLILFSTVAASVAFATEVIVPENAIAGRYIVVLHDDEPATTRSMSAAAINARQERLRGKAADLTRTAGGRADRHFRHVLNGFTAQMTPEQARRMSRDARVRFIEQDAIIRISTTQTNAPWGLDRIDQRDRPADTTYTYTLDGSGVHAYIIDTGIRATHTEYAGRVGNGFTAINDGKGTDDCAGHGSHVSGTVGGRTYGVAKAVTLHPVRVLDCSGSGATSGVIAGVDWVTANHTKPAVANMSLGGGISTALDNAVRSSINAGVVYAIAAGNSNADACTNSPGRVSEALTVGATTSTDARASFSNFGVCLDLFAPGQGIISAGIANDTATANYSGTSMASPHVAGVAALALQATPTATAAQIVAQVIGAASLDKVTGPGTGSPNRLLFATQGTVVTPTDPIPVAAFTANCSALTCDLNGTSSTDNAPITNFAWNFGDGTTATGSTISHQFTSAGTFNVVLTVTDSAGQIDTETKSITVTNPTTGGAPCTSCPVYTGTLSTVGAAQWQPNNTYYQSVAGVHRGWLAGPANANFNLELRRWNGSSWAIVARSDGNTSTEAITYTGSAGYYAWRVVSVSGTGAYQFWLQKP